MNSNRRYFIEPSLDGSRYAEPEELEAQYTEVKYDINSTIPNKAAGIAVEVRQDNEGNVTGALVDGSDTNTIIVSNSGAGKTTRVLSQYILSCIFAKQSMVIHDPKSDLYMYFSKLLKKRGYNVKILNFRDPSTGDSFNSFEKDARLWKAGNQGRAIELARNGAETLFAPIEDVNDKFWTESAINLFLCYFIIACELYEPECVTLGTIYRIHIEGMEKIEPAKTSMQVYLDEHKDSLAYELGSPTFNGPNETRNSIFCVFSNGIARVILNEDIADLTTKSTFEIDDMVKDDKPMALFIITRDEAPKACATLVSSIVDMIYTSLIDLAQKEFNNCLPRTVHFVLEEFGNIAKLENINDMMTASRSRNIRLVIVMQSLCQLYLNYSKEMAHVLIGNSQNLIYMASSDMELVSMISKRCGRIYDDYAKESRPLLSPERLTHLDKSKGETLMLLDRNYPHMVNLPYISAYKMIEPLEKVEFEKRERLDIPKGLLTEAVKKIKDKKMKKLLEEEETEAKKQQMTRRKMVELPKEFASKMNEMIKEVIG